MFLVQFFTDFFLKGNVNNVVLTLAAVLFERKSLRSRTPWVEPIKNLVFEGSVFECRPCCMFVYYFGGGERAELI